MVREHPDILKNMSVDPTDNNPNDTSPHARKSADLANLKASLLPTTAHAASSAMRSAIASLTVEQLDPEKVQEQALQSLSALGQEKRLEVFRLLSKSGDKGMVAGAIAKAVNTPHNTLSSHLNILQNAGLISSQRSGRNITYFMVPSCLSALFAFLLSDCCGAVPERCWPNALVEHSEPQPDNQT